eukprot:CAMPEP_0119528668 /NCGR_PEP_ID=MMETSP1344-20130328/42815_1 /TAXON_ID=236787 /ORGANISM="Florenciella parvula, Strain CCMP2471" /LENGTH=61 /DNA_ID=CAMNT_0007568115 /DNA_START=138 /DNA_END=321 /DNA_ORIENTATION=-
MRKPGGLGRAAGQQGSRAASWPPHLAPSPTLDASSDEASALSLHPPTSGMQVTACSPPPTA